MNDRAAVLTWSRLHTFVAVYDAGSVRAAAQALHVTPPAVSAVLTALDDALGVKLFERSGRGLIATEAADVLAGYARSVLGLVDEALGALGDASRGRVRVGAVATAAEHVLPVLLAGFRAAYPEVDLTLDVRPRDELVRAAGHRELDIVVAGRPPAGSGLVSHATRPNRLVLVAAPGHDTSARTSTWLLPGPGSGTRETALAWLTQHHLTPPTMTLGTSGAAIAGARAGLGVSLVHEDAVSAHVATGDLRRLAMAGLPLDRPWHLATPERPTATARLLVRHLCDPQQVGGGAFHPSPPLRG